MKWIYQCFGLSKQAYYQRIKSDKEKELQTKLMLNMLAPIRKKMTKYGGRKLYLALKEKFKEAHIKIGRDNFFKMLRENGLLVKKTKRYHITTDSKHFFHKSTNLLKDLDLTHAEQVWVCDITYIKLES